MKSWYTERNSHCDSDSLMVARASVPSVGQMTQETFMGVKERMSDMGERNVALGYDASRSVSTPLLVRRESMGRVPIGHI